ncbi:hypothetical protein LAPL110952_12155 [Lactiplantibacillus plajomi]
MKFRHTILYWTFAWGGLLTLAILRIFKTFKILPNSNRVLKGIPIGIAAPTFGILLCLVVFISALGTYLVFFAFNKIKRLSLTFLPRFKTKVYDIYLSSYIVYNLLYVIYIYLYEKTATNFQINIFSLLLGTFISFLIFNYLRKQKISLKNNIEFSSTILVINIITPIYSLIFL